MKKKLLFFGPIGDFGGRDIEVNIIAKAVKDDYQVEVFSTIYISENSYAIQGLDIGFNSFEKELYKNNWLLRILSKLFCFKNKNCKAPYAYIKNDISNRFFDFEKARRNILAKVLSDVDAVIACVQPTSLYLEEAIEICHQQNNPFLIRTTGTIREMDVNSFQFLKKVDCFIHHSESNAHNLNKQLPLPYVIIDQCAQSEQQLLDLPIKENQSIYGYLGRLSTEKGILELIDFFKNKADAKLLIAGDGPLKNDVESAIDKYSQIEYLGQNNPNELDGFFKKINVLIIPSFEESGPLVGLEAMAAGKVILSTDVGAMKERLVDTGNHFWFDNKNEQSFLDSLEKIKNLKSDEFRIIANKNREKYLEEYQYSSIKRKYLDCIKKYLN